MPFSFLMMSILGAAGLAAALSVIPILVHLLHRQKVTPIAWGAMQFLLESPLKVRRRRKIDNLLLMLLRIAILAVLTFLLCRPVWKTENLATSTPVDVAIVIDHSMTMGTRGAGAQGSGTLFDQGLDITEKVSKMLPTSGTMSIILAENAPRIMTPTPMKMGPLERSSDGTPQGEWAKLLQSLHQLKPGMTKGNIAPAVAAARDLLAHGSNTRKIILIVSDNQRTNWEPGDENEKIWKMALGNIDVASGRTGSIPVFSLPVNVQTDAGAGPALTNASVRAVTVLPAFLGVHRPAQILATVANTGTTELSALPIVLEVDGKSVMTRPLATLAAGDSTTVRFDYYFPDAGSHWVRVHAQIVDALEADNSAVAAVNVKPKLPVLVVDGQLTGRGGGGGDAAAFPHAAFLLAAMQPVDPTLDPVTLIDPKVISAAELATAAGFRLEDYPIVILNDVPRLTQATVERLAAHAQAGNGVWMILGPRTEDGFINDVLAKNPLLPMKTKGVSLAPTAQPGDPAPPPPMSVDIKEPANAAVTLMTHGGEAEHNALADVTMRQWWSVTPILPEMRTVIATTSGDPLVLEMDMGKLGGRAIVWTSSVGNLTWNNLPLVPNFVPLVNETLFHLASGQDASTPRQINAGDPVTWTGPNTAVIDTVTLVYPDGTQRNLQPELRGDHYFVEERDTAQPGLYEMRFSSPAQAGAKAPPIAYFSVNIDHDELDPAVLAPADIDWFKGKGYLKDVISTQTLPKAMEATQGGLDLWYWLAIFLLLFLILEVWMTYRLVRQQAGTTLADEGLQTVLPKGAVT